MALEMRQITVVRPADTTAYTANDGISNATSNAANITIADVGRGYIMGVVAHMDTVDITPRLRLFCYATAPTQIADNAACTAPLAADSARYRGYIDLPAMTSPAVTGDDSSHSQDMDLRHPIDSPSLFFIIQTLDAFTPESAATLTLSFFIERGV